MNLNANIMHWGWWKLERLIEYVNFSAWKQVERFTKDRFVEVGHLTQNRLKTVYA